MRCDGRLLALNSYENRVYQLGLEEGGFCVVKFYRPGRWSDAAILEEHRFVAQLAEREVPAVPPMEIPGHGTLACLDGQRFAVFPRQGGHAPELDDPDTLSLMGRLIGRIHGVGATESFRHRPHLNLESFGRSARAFLLDNHIIPPELETVYRQVGGSGPGRGRALLPAGRPCGPAAPARRLPRRQRAVDRRRPPFRGF